jgi:hypothetical protein
MENMQSATTWEKKASEQKKKRSRILQSYENKYPTHLKIAMYAETCNETVKTNTIKLACRRKHNLQYPLNNTVQQDAKI